MGFWRPGEELLLEPLTSARYRYGGAGPRISIKYVGVAEPDARIPSGSLIRISLSRPFAPTTDRMRAGYNSRVGTRSSSRGAMASDERKNARAMVIERGGCNCRRLLRDASLGLAAIYSKTEHRMMLRQRLDGRSDSAVEMKHRNISAVLDERGLRYISGYKPAHNYQRELAEEVDRARLQIRCSPRLSRRDR